MLHDRINEFLKDPSEAVRRLRSRAAHVLGWMGVREYPTTGIGFVEPELDTDRLIKISNINLVPDSNKVDTYTSAIERRLAEAHTQVVTINSN
jgi:hypothetical protein